MVSLYFRSNCVIKLNTVLPPYWFFSLLFDRTKGTVINKNSNIIIIMMMMMMMRRRRRMMMMMMIIIIIIK